MLFFVSYPPLLAEHSFSKVFYDENGALLRVTLSNDEKYRIKTTLSEIPSSYIELTLLKEDRYFFQHVGINPFALVKALARTYILQKKRMGASTITMQLARIRYGIHTKTWRGKLQQIWYALYLEMHYSKKEILEAYFNLAPYGNNIEGIGSASLIYFGKKISALSLPEMLTLTILPQNPSYQLPSSKAFKKNRQQLFNDWVKVHPEDINKKIMLDLPLQMQSLKMLPFKAPHFVNENLENVSFDVYTTLDLSLQNLTEKISKKYIFRQRAWGVNNLAVLLIDSRDMGIKALLGSADFFNTKIQGQVNGATAKRSPGSTLKPFIYALALEQGLIHPHTILKDVPHRFGVYNPENFDYDFLGPIKAKDALQLSRNIPAIFLSDQLHDPSLYTLLKEAHIQKLKSEQHYGLALALGGAEITMQELGSLYAMLVNDGKWKPLRQLKNDPFTEGEALLSPEASFLVLEMLTAKAHGKIPVAYKTGTSSGYRDAWSVGMFGPYVLLVWVGNFNNQANPALVGKTMALPLMFELIDAIQQEKKISSSQTKDLRKMNVTKIPVCKLSGFLPTRYCQDTEMTWFIPGKSPITTDNIFREIAINKISGLRTCHFDQNTRFAIYEFWPSDFLKIFRAAGMARRVPPAFEPDCIANQHTELGIHPNITSPQHHLRYITRAYSPEIPLTAIGDADVRYFYWFINEAYLGKSSRDVPLLWSAKPGHYTIRVVDDAGRGDAIDIRVSAH
jgi:penicillin-binding protein 1C